MDTRDRANSGDTLDRIRHEKMTDDLAALLDQLRSAPANVLGWNDGGFEALLLDICYPAKGRRIAAMAAHRTGGS